MAGRVPGYRFSTFIVSPKRRVVLDGGRELPLIPRYFDLLVLLLERRHEAVRTIRRALGDDPREPRFIRTVSRHGYRFVFPGVVETDDEETAAPPPGPPPGGAGTEADYEALIARVTSPARTDADDEEQRDAAEQLHALGTEEALRRLDARPGHAHARALLRDARWESPRAGDVPLLGAPNPIGVAREVIALRLQRAARLVARRTPSPARRADRRSRSRRSAGSSASRASGRSRARSSVSPKARGSAWASRSASRTSHNFVTARSRLGADGRSSSSPGGTARCTPARPRRPAPTPASASRPNTRRSSSTSPARSRPSSRPPAPRAFFYRRDDAETRTVNVEPGERANGHSHCRESGRRPSGARGTPRPSPDSCSARSGRWGSAAPRRPRRPADRASARA